MKEYPSRYAVSGVPRIQPFVSHSPPSPTRFAPAYENCRKGPSSSTMQGILYRQTSFIILTVLLTAIFIISFFVFDTVYACIACTAKISKVFQRDVSQRRVTGDTEGHVLVVLSSSI